MNNDIKGKGKEQPPSASSKSNSHATVEEDDDDFDELDDVLDQFKAAPLHTQASSSVTPTTAAVYDRVNATSSTAEDGDDNNDEDEDEDFEAVFAAELAKEMEKMLGGLKPSSDNVEIPGRAGSTGNDGVETEEEKGFREAFEKIMKDSTTGVGGSGGGEDGLDLEELSKLMTGLGGAAAAGAGAPSTTTKNKSTSSTSSSSAPASTQPPQSFQDTIKATMSKLAESEAGHQSRSGKTAGSSDPNDPLAALMAQMEAMGGAGGLGGEGGDEGDLPELLDGLMDQLMSKELLYDPITELRVKYPAYLNSPEGQALPQDEKDRYTTQSEIISQISTIFESPDYSDSNKKTREKISILMQQMQDAGAPPKHLLGELGPAMALGGLGEGGPDGEACVVA